MIEAFLKDHGITFERFDHPAVFTCEESERLEMEIPGARTKNLFLRDDKGKRHFLVSIPHEKKLDLKAFGAMVGAKSIGFASPERLKKYLGVDPGSVTILGLVNDHEKEVEVWIDEDLWRAEKIGCHPLVNTATLVIPHEGLETFLKSTGHTAQVYAFP